MPWHPHLPTGDTHADLRRPPLRRRRLGGSLGRRRRQSSRLPDWRHSYLSRTAWWGVLGHRFVGPVGHEHVSERVEVEPGGAAEPVADPPRAIVGLVVLVAPAGSSAISSAFLRATSGSTTRCCC
jgi:hypothetical protein